MKRKRIKGNYIINIIITKVSPISIAETKTVAEPCAACRAAPCDTNALAAKPKTVAKPKTFAESMPGDDTWVSKPAPIIYIYIYMPFNIYIYMYFFIS